MLKQISIKGFQAYKKEVVIKLHKGVNIIIGPSHSGKSSIVRSFKWVFQNRPQGDRFRNRLLGDKDPVSVKIKFPKDLQLSRIKSPSKNHYEASNQEQPFQALRTDVPTEVSKITRMKSINIQGQHPNEQYFLLTESPGAVAKAFNKVSGLSIVDKTITEVNKRKRSLSSSIKVYDQEIKEANTEIADTHWVPEAMKEAKSLQGKFRHLDTTKRAIEIGTDLIKEIEEIDAVLNGKYKHLDETLEAFEDLEESRNVLNKSLGESQVLDGVLNNAIDADKKISEYSDIEKALNELESAISWHESNVSKPTNERKRIKSTLTDIEAQDILIKEHEAVLKKAEADFKKLTKTETCPTCGRTGK